MAGSREATQRAAGVSAHRPLIIQANDTYAHNQHKICICDNSLIFKVIDEVVFSRAMAMLNELRIENHCCIQLLVMPLLNAPSIVYACVKSLHMLHVPVHMQVSLLRAQAEAGAQVHAQEAALAAAREDAARTAQQVAALKAEVEKYQDAVKVGVEVLLAFGQRQGT